MNDNDEIPEVPEQPLWDTGHQAHGHYNCIPAYQELATGVAEQWLSCPRCKLKPRIWVFDNRRGTACGCWTSTYDHWSIFAESIMSHVKRHAGSVATYDSDGLRKNWNHWCESGEVLFDRDRALAKGMW